MTDVTPEQRANDRWWIELISAEDRARRAVVEAARQLDEQWKDAYGKYLGILHGPLVELERIENELQGRVARVEGKP